MPQNTDEHRCSQTVGPSAKQWDTGGAIYLERDIGATVCLGPTASKTAHCMENRCKLFSTFHLFLSTSKIPFWFFQVVKTCTGHVFHRSQMTAKKWNFQTRNLYYQVPSLYVSVTYSESNIQLPNKTDITRSPQESFQITQGFPYNS